MKLDPPPQKISDGVGGFRLGLVNDGDSFGFSVASLGDLDTDGVADLAVGAFLDDDGGTDRGAVSVLFLNGVAESIPTDSEWGMVAIMLLLLTAGTLVYTRRRVDSAQSFGLHFNSQDRLAARPFPPGTVVVW